MSNSHDTKCLRSACAIMGCYLNSHDRFITDALRWLSMKGDVCVRSTMDDYATPASWSVFVRLHEPTEGFKSAQAGGVNLAEALCGAIHCFEEPEGGASRDE